MENTERKNKKTQSGRDEASRFIWKDGSVKEKKRTKKEHSLTLFARGAVPQSSQTPVQRHWATVLVAIRTVLAETGDLRPPKTRTEQGGSNK